MPGKYLQKMRLSGQRIEHHIIARPTTPLQRFISGHTPFLQPTGRVVDPVGWTARGCLVLGQLSASRSRYTRRSTDSSALRRARHRTSGAQPAPTAASLPAAAVPNASGPEPPRPQAGTSFSVCGCYLWRKIWHSGPAGSEPSMPSLVMSSVACWNPLASAFWAHSEKVNALALLTVTSTDTAVAPPSKKRRRASSRLASAASRAVAPAEPASPRRETRFGCS